MHLAALLVWPRVDSDTMGVTAQPDSPGVCGPHQKFMDLDALSGTGSYDTIGTIPCVHAHTAALTPGETREAYVARSTVEVRKNGSILLGSLWWIGKNVGVQKGWH